MSTAICSIRLRSLSCCRTWPDSACSVFAVGCVATPAGNPLVHFLKVLQAIAVPAVALSVAFVGLHSRYLRSSLLVSLHAPFTTAAYAKGLSERRVVLHHALRNALIPIVTVLGLQLGRLLAGSVIVETVFARQGIGQLAVEAILSKDYPLVQGIILLTASVYVVTNVLVDLAYGYLDPRIRAGGDA